MEDPTEYTATNVRLPRAMLDALKYRAVRERTSLAQLIRDAVDQTYGLGKGKSVSFRDDPLFKLNGTVNSGLKDGATNHDRDIYGVE